MLKIAGSIILIATAVAVSPAGLAQDKAQGTAGAKSTNGCDQDNGGLTLPSGFCASVFADNLGRARHLTVAPSGDVYVTTWSSSYTDLKTAPGGTSWPCATLIAMARPIKSSVSAQCTRSGKAGGGTGIAVALDSLYVEDNGTIVRYRLGGGRLVPQGNPEVILSGLWTERGHIMHPFAITSNGVMYVNFGSITNTC